jgi:hypothetical protein
VRPTSTDFLIFVILENYLSFLLLFFFFRDLRICLVDTRMGEGKCLANVCIGFLVLFMEWEPFFWMLLCWPNE